MESRILERLRGTPYSPISKKFSTQGLPIYYRKAGGRYYKVITLTPTGSNAEGVISVDSQLQGAIAAVMSSSLYYWYWLIHSDWHNMRSLEVGWFPLPQMNKCDITQLGNLYSDYYADLQRKSKVTKTGLRCYFARQSKHLIDKIDDYLCPLYGLSPEETEYIKKYDSEFRLGDDE